jgi:hypothetical protein
MRIVPLRSLLVGALFASLTGAPAAAIEDLEGTYDVKLACRGLAMAAKDKYKLETELSITQPNPESVLFVIEQLTSGARYLLSDQATQGNGTLSGVSCELSTATFQGATLQVDVKTRPGSDQASFAGTLHLFDHSGGEAHLCKIKGKRVNTTPPNLPGCP